MTTNDQLHPLLQEHLRKSIPLLSSFFAASAVVHLAILNGTGEILYANKTLAEALKVPENELAGKNFKDYLTEPDGESLAKFLTIARCPPKGFLLNIVDREQIPHSLHFVIESLTEGVLLLGEPPRDDNQSLQEELIQLNNQLSVLSRENVRKGRELSRALADLKKTQSMMVHQEKMASLGQMTAGIAHEINNPLAFVLGNEQVLQRDFDDLFAFINTLGDTLPEIATLAPHIHAEIIDKAGEVGLEYLAEAVPRKITANIEGLERVKNIILDLRNFSRLDEAEQKLCDLNEGIAATIRFLGPLRQESGVTIETDFADLPPLLCAPGPLNQAVSNIVANAIQASQAGQIVQITTRRSENWYVIEVCDHGCGIAAGDLDKVFDPFFTTKPVGSGTGLGLSIAHQVVATQGGKIEIESQPGAGTTLRILLPAEV